MSKPKLTLGIETSCDETAAAVIEDGLKIRSNVIASQIDFHQRFGGVVPEIASRKHIEAVFPVIDQALSEANTTLEEIDLIAVTYGPGLVGALLVGVAAAKALAFALNKPLVGVNHIEGHIYANFLAEPNLKPPFICLTVSGGHTDLLYIPKFGEYEILGRTRDDAAGEAFDKIARVLGLPYPGGPQIDRLAKGGNPQAIDFPRGLAVEDTFDFSFSGLKTAALNYINQMRQKNQEIHLSDFAASYQWAIIDVLSDKVIRAAKSKNVKQVILSGGVASNSQLRAHVEALAKPLGISVLYPPLILCTDNAAMIGSAGYFKYLAGQQAGWDLNADPNLRLNN
ncbi:MAG: tRNA (adenosine(37)-N6)-threonylcarbamoyltransferase complex transferase subunit TsaD [Firmicutes bacterium]|nr:tRNA (adenosine(37)-N6)-threonylcarbamoyltransferase complex transferase subunit TsaD [Bacillota bacterium]